MKVQLTKNDYNSKDIDLIDGNKTLNIMFGGTGFLCKLDKLSIQTYEINNSKFEKS